MLFLISSAPDTKEFKSAYQMAQNMNADICLLQNAIYASRDLYDNRLFVLKDDMQLRGISKDEISGIPIDYGQLVDIMAHADKVIGLF